jgi:hypothetical protein
VYSVQCTVQRVLTFGVTTMGVVDQSNALTGLRFNYLYIYQVTICTLYTSTVYIRQVQRIRFWPLLSVQYAARDVHRAPPSAGDGGDGVRTDILAGDGVVAADSAVVAANSASVDPLKALPAQGVQKPAR